jgi:tetratricopeptide (TPR) repeat protein
MRVRHIVLSCSLLGTAVAHGQAIGILDRDIKELEALVRSDTNDAQLQYYLGLAHWKRHHWQQTDSLLRLAVRLEPRYAEAYLALYYLPYARRSTLFAEELRGRVPESWRPLVAEAQRFYQRAFRTDPLVSLRVMSIVFDIREPTFNRAVKQGQRDEIVHVPLRDNEYRFMLAALHHVAGHADSAIFLYQSAIEHDLGLVMAHTYLAGIHETAGEPLRRAVALNAMYAPPYYLLGRIAQEMGRSADARQEYTLFLSRAPQRLRDLTVDAQQRLAALAS